MDSFQTFILLMFAATILVGLAQYIRVPYPIALVLGGTMIGFTPHHQDFHFDPNLILVVVLPPLLYHASFGISYREFKRNIKDVLSLALGLVLCTTLVVAITFKWMFPELPWALAFAFGAIVSPPDAVAATTIIKRFAISTRLVTILEGESLINDASALILYKLAVIALLSGTLSLADGSVEFVKIVTGGIIVGLIMGYILQNFSRRYLEPVVAVIFSFTIPYITYIIADYIGVSGVLAIVVNGLAGSQMLIRHYSPLRRVLGYASWDIFVILMNCFVFILIGLQLSVFTQEMTSRQLALYTGYAALITLIMLLVRMIWVYAGSGIAYLKALRSPKSDKLCPQILREAVIIGWSGMRGIVSLAAALALPLTLSDGTPLEGRNIVIFITFMVIFFTLLIPGFTLPVLIQWLNIRRQSEHPHLLKMRNILTKVADDTIQHLFLIKKINREEFEVLKVHHELHSKIFTSSEDQEIPNLEAARNIVIQAKRKKLFMLWESLEIDDRTLQHLEQELDLEEIHVARALLK